MGLLDNLTRFGGSEAHEAGAFLGGVTSQKQEPKPTSVQDVSTLEALNRIYDLLQKWEKEKEKPESVRETVSFDNSPTTFDSQGYRYSTLITSATGTLTVNLGGYSYTISISPGVNYVDFPNESMITASSPIQGVLIRSMYPLSQQ